MARLTILQASQQGFGSTLTIHRHIKDGSLPIYQEGDVKLLEVDDLISLFGEPGLPVNDNRTSSEQPEIDIYEYNRMKSELDQKNKKNMWLAADLDEAVRDLREKEATFHAERDRLLKILEQAQALLLREAKRAGAGQKQKDMAELNMGGTASPAPPPKDQPDIGSESMQAGDDLLFQAATQDTSMGTVEAALPDETDELILPGNEPIAADSTLSEPSPDVLTRTGSNAPSIVLDAEERQRSRGNTANPLIPPLEEEEDKPAKSRLMGTFAWLVLFSVVGCGLVFLKFRPEIMTSIKEIMQVLGAA